MYQLTTNPSIIYMVESGSMISQTSSPAAWAEYEAWLATGNTPLPGPYDIAVTLEQAKQHKTDEINVACEETIISGFPSSALGEVHYYDSGIEDQINLIGAAFAASAGQSVEFRCYQGSMSGEKEWHLHSPAQMIQVYQDGLVYKITQLKKATALKNTVKAATTLEEVGAVEWQ